MNILEVKGLEVIRNAMKVLTVEHLAVAEKETLALIGPNGAGKSTLLLVLSRLLKQHAGTILYRGQDVSTLGDLAYRRKIGLVLQDPLLLDGSVFDNVASGLCFRRVPKAEIHQRVDDWLEKLGIRHLRNRASRALSGGEAQRVSLARAFVLDPDLLLLDEPFTALDTPTRLRLLEDFRLLVRQSGVTVIFVTHDQNEALLLGDRIGVMMAGRLAQVDQPEIVFNAPASAEVAEFVGVETIIPARVIHQAEGMVIADTGTFQVEVVGDCRVGQDVYICIRPEDVTLLLDSDGSSSARNRLEGVIIRTTPQGPLERLVLDCGLPIVALLTRASATQMKLQTGTRVRASFKASSVHLVGR